MTRSTSIFVSLTLATTLMSGCATQRQTDVLSGALIGGLLGGAVGLIIDQNVEEISIGFGIGASLGAATVLLTRERYEEIPGAQTRAGEDYDWRAEREMDRAMQAALRDPDPGSPELRLTELDATGVAHD